MSAYGWANRHNRLDYLRLMQLGILASLRAFLLLGHSQQLETAGVARHPNTEPQETELGRGQGIKSVLEMIDSKGMRILKSGKPWEEGMIDVAALLAGFTLAELHLIDDWISAWRARIIKANGLNTS